MKELIIRIKDTSKDAEILYNNLITNEQIEKNISLDTLISILSKAPAADEGNVACSYIDPSIIGIGSSGNKKAVIVNQPEHVRYITYSVTNKDNITENKVYKINFPGAIYKVIIDIAKSEIKDIYAYMYLKYEALQTKLYQYAMPNMLSGNKICIGQADRSINDDNILQSLENIIYAPYSHEILNNIKGFRSTNKYFDYLTKNNIQERYLCDIKKILNDVFRKDDYDN